MKLPAPKVAPPPLEPKPRGEIAPSPRRIGTRLRTLLSRFQHNPDDEEQTAEERRQRLLDHLSKTVAEAPDDRPIRDVIRQLNRHWDD